MSDLLSGLNQEQLTAVTLPRTHALILAGAGSGKTRVLTTRIAWLLQTGQTGPMGLLAVTFTNKAAKEMLVRLSGMVQVNTRGMWVGTFHGLCHRLLRAHYQEANLPQTFQILDSSDQLSLIKRLLKQLNVDDEKYPPKALQSFINGQKEQGIRAVDSSAWDDFSQKLIELYALYEQQCQREGVVDFAELLLRSVELLQRNESLRQHYQQRFAYLLVDEFQDTNRLQYQWLKLLSGQQTAVFAVGDDDQSIYAFRGANVGNMRDFEREFQVAHLIRLEQNYRSQGNILDAANALIAHNPERLGKNLWTDAGQGEPLRVFVANQDNEEAAYIVDEVKQLHREGMDLDEMAVLYRSNAQSRIIEHALFNAAIPYRVYGGLRFFERQEIKHALAYLRLVANPDDDGAFLRVVNVPTRGIGARSLEAIQTHAQQTGLSLWQAACSGVIKGKTAAQLAIFVQMIEAIRQQLNDFSLLDVTEEVLARSGLRAMYEQDKDGQDRLENLDELLNAVKTFAYNPDEMPLEALDRMAFTEEDVPLAGNAQSQLQSFLAHATLEAGERQAGEGEQALQLMTIHSAKGLEFNAVFLTGLEEGLFPHENSFNEQGGLYEERRLMYVALTRARQRLYLSYALIRLLHGQTRYPIPSRFLDEIPSGLLQWSNRTSPKVAAPLVSSANHHAAQQGWRIGQTVEHSKFGQGVVLGIEGSGEDLRLQINFGAAYGIKWLIAQMAKLQRA